MYVMIIDKACRVKILLKCAPRNQNNEFMIFQTVLTGSAVYFHLVLSRVISFPLSSLVMECSHVPSSSVG